MAKTKQQKKVILDDLQATVSNAKSATFVSFDKLKAQDETDLRKTLEHNNVSYKVVKKTLLKKALAGTKIEGALPELGGMVAVAFGEDLIAPARESYNFQKAHKETFQIVGGIFEGRYMSQAEMLSIATIPETPVLRGMFVNVINSPIQRFVVALNQIAGQKAT